MDYSKIYENLIIDAQLNPKADSYKERHHIVPKCLGGDDSSYNLIYLDRKSTRLNSSHSQQSRMPSSA